MAPRPKWSAADTAALRQGLAAVLLDEWGGPRSPLALQYLHEVVIPELAFCLMQNSDLLANSSFAQIVEWKLKNQYAYPQAAAHELAGDLLKACFNLSVPEQITNPAEPWRRILRLWISGEPLTSIAERFGYPLDYLDLLLLRLKKISLFAHRLSMEECLELGEFKEYGPEQLNFLYRFQAAASKPFFREEQAIEQVIYELGFPLTQSGLVLLLKTIHAEEGKLEKKSLAETLSGVNFTFEGSFPDSYINLAVLVNGLIRLHWLQENKAGKLTLTAKSAKILAPLIIPEITSSIKNYLAAGDYMLAAAKLLNLNPEVILPLIQRLAEEIPQDLSAPLLSGIYKRVNKTVDIHVLKALGRTGKPSVAFISSCLEERDGLIRATACAALGLTGCKEAAEFLRPCLKDPVSGVREQAAAALGQVDDQSSISELERLAGDFAECIAVRESALEALRRLKKGC